MAAFDPRDRSEVGAAKGNAGYGGGGFGNRANERTNPYDSRLRNPRYAQSRGVARPATPGNLGTAASLALGMGPASVVQGARMIGGWDPYSGPSAPRANFSYDPKDRADIRRQILGRALRGRP